MIVKALVYTLSDPGFHLGRGSGGGLPAGELQRQDGPADPARLLGRRRRGQGSHGLVVTERSSSHGLMVTERSSSVLALALVDVVQ